MDAHYPVIMQRLSRIEEAVNSLLNLHKPDPKNFIGPSECMQITGCRSLRAQHRWLRKHGIKRYGHGKYRRQDVSNKLVELSSK